MSSPVQRRNNWIVIVSFPANWTDEPALAGTTQKFYYRTEEAADLAAEGFKLRGARL